MVAGSYNAATGTWAGGNTFNLERNGNKFVVNGVLPYVNADSVIPTDCNRLTVRFFKDGISSKDQLPSGNIVKIMNKDLPGGWGIYDKSVFEDDGSLIAEIKVLPGELNRVREVKIAWTTAGKFTTYKFDLSNATLEDPVTPPTPPTPPTPTPTLTQFSVSDITNRIACNTEMSIDEVVAELEKLTYTQAEQTDLAILAEAPEAQGAYGLIAAQRAVMGDVTVYALLSGDTLLFVSMGMNGLQAGWQSNELDEDGIFNRGWSFTISQLNQASIWNGILMGYATPVEPTPSLTPYSDNDTIANGDKIYFDTEAHIAQILAGLTYEEVDEGVYQCILISTLVGEDMQPILTAQRIGDVYILELNSNTNITPTDPEGIFTVWASAAVQEAGISEGWQNIDDDGSVTLSADTSATISVSSQSGWNGIICGTKEE